MLINLFVGLYKDICLYIGSYKGEYNILFSLPVRVSKETIKFTLIYRNRGHNNFSK